MQNPIARWDTLIAGGKPTAELHKAIWFVAYTLSNLTNQPISVASHRIKRAPIGEIATQAADAQAEAVGVYLLLGDDLPGQAILMLRRQAALAAVDLMQGSRPGTMMQLGDIERSALGELGNVAASSFLNVVAQPSWGPLHPSPPAVMVDRLGIVLDAVATSIARTCDTLDIIDTEFQDAAKSCPMQLWIIPNPTSDV